MPLDTVRSEFQPSQTLITHFPKIYISDLPSSALSSKLLFSSIDNATRHDHNYVCYCAIGSPHRGVSPARRASPACRGPTPVPASVTSIPVAVSPMPRGLSPMRVGVDSGGRHKIPPLSPHKQKDWVVDSGFSNTADGRNDVSK
jgi:hypothetical protein